MLKGSLLFRSLLYAFLAVTGVVSIYPIYWIFVASSLTSTEIFHYPPYAFFHSSFFQNLQVLQSQMPVFWDVFNSILVSSVTTISIVLFSTLVGYTFAKYNFPLKKTLFMVVLATIMIPVQTSLIPLFLLITQLHWQNTYQALIVPFLVNGFGVFFMRQQMQSFPDELIESARMDGSGEFATFVRIVVPSMLPSMAALGILTFLQQWSNFIWPLIVIDDSDKFTIPLMLSTMIQGGNVIQYGAVFAGAAVGLIPLFIVFLFLQRFFMSGVFGGAVKG